MKQVLIYLVDFLKEHHEMSMSRISKGLGKSRNFIQQAIARGYDNDEKYKSLIADLDYQFFVSGDYTDFLKFMESKHQEEIHKTETSIDKIVDHLHERVESYQVALKQSLESNLEEMDKKNKTISDLEHRIVVLSRNVDKGCEEVNKLNEVIATKDLFIDGQDKEIKDLEFRINSYISMSDSQQEVIQNLKADIKHSEELVGIRSNQIDKQNKEIKDYNDLCNRQRKTIKETRENISRMELKHRIKNRILTGALIGVGLLWAVSVWVMS